MFNSRLVFAVYPLECTYSLRAWATRWVAILRVVVPALSFKLPRNGRISPQTHKYNLFTMHYFTFSSSLRTDQDFFINQVLLNFLIFAPPAWVNILFIFLVSTYLFLLSHKLCKKL